jgi:2-polyprenyl-3-methyl-5-hydroxy-6-metoxy-1,4-benzoquinol methylase
MDVKEEGLIKGDIGTHWYYRAKLTALRSIIRDLSPSSVLDVGAGLGFFSRALLRETEISSATCIDPGYPADHDETVSGKSLRFRRCVERSEADLVLMMDVVEHVKNDVDLVAEYAAKVRSGTRFVVTVPAFMWLWSGHDVFLEHYRRYTLSGIERTLRAGGLRIEQGCYFYACLLPLVVAQRIPGSLLRRRHFPPKSAMRDYGVLLNALLWSICRMELPVFTANRVAGLTAFVRASKK